MKIAVLGLGYVGFTAACCLAEQGHNVLGIDVNEGKIRGILEGVSPIKEPGVDELLRKALDNGRFMATVEVGGEINDCDMAIVCVGTPSAPDGAHDMRYIIEASVQLAAAIDPKRETPITIVYRSTVRPGTMEELLLPIFTAKLGKDVLRVVELIYNPEFLRESSAVYDYFNPPKIVVGSRDGKGCRNLDIVNSNISAPVFNVGYREAEITKFVDNSWHAVKVAFANEVGRVCMRMGISASKVHEVFVSDTKLNISDYYTRPGGAFGGSCLPKDVRAFQRIAADCGANTHLVDSLLRSNDAHKRQLFEYASAGLPTGARILLAGLAFKAHTDDLRESPNVDLARMLLHAGYNLSIYDPAVNAAKLVGANLGYAFSQIPQLERLLVSKEEAESAQFDRVIAANATIQDLSLAPSLPVVNLGALA